MKKILIFIISLITLILIFTPLTKAGSKSANIKPAMLIASNENSHQAEEGQDKKETVEKEAKKQGREEAEESHGESKGEHGEGGGHEEEIEEIHHDAGVFEFEAHHANWKVPAWKVIFSVLSVLFFGIAINTLPKFITDKSAGGGEHH